MEALREIHEVHSNSITVHLPNQFSKQVEVIVLPVVTERHITAQEKEESWKRIDAIREQLERSGRTFSDSAELIREDRGW
jgi:cysteinyl-tRNA synthetase